MPRRGTSLLALKGRRSPKPPSYANVDVQHVLRRILVTVTKEWSAFVVPTLSTAPQAVRALSERPVGITTEMLAS